MFNRDYREMLRQWRADNRHRRDVPLVKSLEPGEAEVFIYDIIGEDFFGDGVSARELVPRLHRIDASKIIVRVNSPGGVISDAVAIRNALLEHPATIETHVDGAAYSAASWIGLGAGDVVMHPATSMFIHDAMSMAWGNEADFRQAADELGKFSTQIAEIYAAAAGGHADEWRARMRAEELFTAEEAVEVGLGTRMAEAPALQNSKPEPTKRNAERALRDAGFSREDAKALLSGGTPRDVSDASDHIWTVLLSAPSQGVSR